MTHIIDQLASVSMPGVFNPWRDHDPMDLEPTTAAQDRRNRLIEHFDCDPQFVLIGEAPGYQGCHFSGVPFTNEALLIEGGIPRVTVHRRLTSRPLPWREPSATIVWRALYELRIEARVVMWNAFAFHPHLRGNIHSNRSPTRGELSSALGILRGVLDLYAGVRVIAVGNNAEWSLMQLGIKYDGKVRHPANGGAREFREQLAKLCGKEADAPIG